MYRELLYFLHCFFQTAAVDVKSTVNEIDHTIDHEVQLNHQAQGL